MPFRQELCEAGVFEAPLAAHGRGGARGRSPLRCPHLSSGGFVGLGLLFFFSPASSNSSTELLHIQAGRFGRQKAARMPRFRQELLAKLGAGEKHVPFRALKQCPRFSMSRKALTSIIPHPSLLIGPTLVRHS